MEARLELVRRGLGGALFGFEFQSRWAWMPGLWPASMLLCSFLGQSGRIEKWKEENQIDEQEEEEEATWAGVVI